MSETLLSTDLDAVASHMRGLGFGALAHATWHGAFYSPDNAYWSQLSILQAAHCCEILIKARIAQEHPLLVFKDLPRQVGADATGLTLEHLLEDGKTYQYSELPDRLWATTGIGVPAVAAYRRFGRLRNTIQHFTYPQGRNLSYECLQFIFEVVDPFINTCWGEYAVDYCEDSEPYTYYVGFLMRHKIEFLVSPMLAASWKDIDLDDWPEDAPEYRRKMEKRVADTLAGRP